MLLTYEEILRTWSCERTAGAETRAQSGDVQFRNLQTACRSVRGDAMSCQTRAQEPFVAKHQWGCFYVDLCSSGERDVLHSLEWWILLLIAYLPRLRKTKKKLKGFETLPESDTARVQQRCCVVAFCLGKTPREDEKRTTEGSEKKQFFSSKSRK